jgi:predicted phage-related endonuclease
MLDHEMRRLAIGGSEIGAVLGCDPDRDGFSVWAQKKGGLPRLSDQEVPIEWVMGRMLEEGVLKIYAHKTGRATIYDNKSKQHPDRKYMVYTPDGLCEHERRGVDAKVVRWDQRHKWGDTEAEIPMRIVAQCWWYMAAMEYDQWDVAALIGGQDLRVYTLDRDLDGEKEMLYRAEEFYRRFLVGNEVPPIGVSSDAERWLKARFPRNTQPMIYAAVDEYDALNEYSELRLQNKDLEKEIKRLELLIKARIADAEGIRWPNGRITYRADKSSIETDWKELGLDLLKSATPEERELIIKGYSEVKPGSRRLLWHYEEPGPDPAALNVEVPLELNP